MKNDFQEYKDISGVDGSTFRVYPSWVSLLGFEPTQKAYTCPFCSADRKAKNQKLLVFAVKTQMQDSGTFKCHHCGIKGYVNPEMFRENTKPVKVDVINTDQEAMNVWSEIYANRGIEMETAIRYSVAFTMHTFKDKETDEYVKSPARCFPYMVGGRIVQYKYRDPQKRISRTAQTQLTYGGIAQLPSQIERLIIVEGEEDLLIVAQSIKKANKHNWGVVTLPNGSNKNQNLIFHRLSWYLVDKRLNADAMVVIYTDNDQSGIDMADRLVGILGHENCLRAKGKHNDANKEYLEEGGADAVISVIENAQPFPVQELTSGMEVLDTILAANSVGRQPFRKIGYPSLDAKFTWKPGANTMLVAAPPGTAKSDFMYNVAIRLAAIHDEVFAVFSPETGSASMVYEALLEIAIGKYINRTSHYEHGQLANEAEIKSAMQFVQRHFIVITPDLPNTVYTLDYLHEQVLACKRLYGITSYIVDPINKIDGMFFATGQQNIAANLITSYNAITSFNRMHNLGCYLVAHPSDVDPTKMIKVNDIFGGSIHQTMVDVILAMQRLYDTSQAQPDGFGDLINMKFMKVKSREAGTIGQVDKSFVYEIANRRISEPNEWQETKEWGETYLTLSRFRITFDDKALEIDDLPF
jgi:5S rRNA maturation endonuclease (ribonuclease M5)